MRSIEKEISAPGKHAMSAKRFNAIKPNSHKTTSRMKAVPGLIVLLYVPVAAGSYHGQ